MGGRWNFSFGPCKIKEETQMGIKAWVASLILTILAILVGTYGYKKKSRIFLIQAGVIYYAALVLSFYAIFTFLGWK